LTAHTGIIIFIIIRNSTDWLWPWQSGYGPLSLHLQG